MKAWKAKTAPAHPKQINGEAAAAITALRRSPLTSRVKKVAITPSISAPTLLTMRPATAHGLTIRGAVEVPEIDR